MINQIVVLGRLIPDSGKIHQNQEVYDEGGVLCSLKATTYKDPPKVLIDERNHSDRQYKRGFEEVY